VLVVPLVAEKVNEAGVSDTTGAAAAVPVPLSAIVCGDPVALSTTDTVALKLAAEAGVNVTEMEQLALAASELPQVLVCAKSAAPVPPSVMLVMLRAALPVFLSVAV
jgi:hypothetical protein